MTLSSLVAGRLERRYKRFLVDVLLDSGESITAHCPNTGAMTGLTDAGARVWLSYSDNPKRKYALTLELVETATGLACIHSARANALVKAGIGTGIIPALSGALDIRSEVRYGAGSRADLLLDMGSTRIFVEVKAVTFDVGKGLGLFPDTVSVRATKHVQELASVLDVQTRAALVFCIFHSGINRVAPAEAIDPKYARELKAAVQAGVEVYAMSADVSPQGIKPCKQVPVEGLES